jgi:hypothetical protein
MRHYFAEAPKKLRKEKLLRNGRFLLEHERAVRRACCGVPSRDPTPGACLGTYPLHPLASSADNRRNFALADMVYLLPKSLGEAGGAE